MTDILLYRRFSRSKWDDAEKSTCWYTNVRWLADLQPGDYLWLVTSGANLRREERQAGFLVALWAVAGVAENPGDDPAHPRDDFRFRIVADDSGSVTLDDPVLIDDILRPEGRDRMEPIGRFLSAPKRLDERQVRRLRAAAGPELALKWLTGNRR